MKILAAVGLVLVASLGHAQASDTADMRVISTKIWHLGNDALPEWTEASAEPEGSRVDWTFEGRAFSGEGLLFLQQRDVNNTWLMQLNGKPMGALQTSEDSLMEFHYEIPAGLMVDGVNKLSVIATNPADDILIGNVRYLEKSTRDHFLLKPFALHVSQTVNGLVEDMPARITIVDSKGTMVQMYYAKAEHVAVRPGVLYTGTGHAVAELPMGDYQVYASRGMEWSRAKVGLHLGVDDSKENMQTVELELAHEIDTPGFVAADTHIHTLTHSGHGDSSVEERQITLAGEGVELAIATDHNHNIDYAPTQKRLGLSAYYTPVIGNEVTTPIGHFNAFPLKASDPVPLYDSRDLAAMIADMRAKGARTVILNHPRWPEGAKAPFATIGLDTRTGFWKGPWASGYDAMELINSDTRAADPLQLYRDWFALMNRGEAVVAVGASDSHEVGIVVGQGRTYVKSKISDVSALDVQECSDNIARGHSSVSMGIFTDLRRNGESVMGEQLSANYAQPLPDGLRLRIAAPSWVNPEELMIYVNGQRVLTMPLEASTKVGDAPFDSYINLTSEMKLPDHDYWLVAVVQGAKVTEPFWPMRNDYTLASTNPIYVDVDGDGQFSCARQLAEDGLQEVGTEAAAVLGFLSGVDGAVAAQVMRLVRMEYRKQAKDRIQGLERNALEQQPSLKEWVDETR
ncbi:MAG: hypothetical protein ACI9X4_001164 [Glaciecola sp.]|jgi:hypothetical protein